MSGTVTTDQIDSTTGLPSPQKNTDGAAHVTLRSSEFKPSTYYAVDLTMDADGTSVTLATGVALGLGTVNIMNNGATGEPVRVAFGTSVADALANLTFVANAATTGYKIPAFADGGSLCRVLLSVPALATHLHVGPAVAAKVNTVSVMQGV